MVISFNSLQGTQKLFIDKEALLSCNVFYIIDKQSRTGDLIFITVTTQFGAKEKIRLVPYEIKEYRDLTKDEAIKVRAYFVKKTRNIEKDTISCDDILNKAIKNIKGLRNEE